MTFPTQFEMTPAIEWLEGPEAQQQAGAILARFEGQVVRRMFELIDDEHHPFHGGNWESHAMRAYFPHHTEGSDAA